MFGAIAALRRLAYRLRLLRSADPGLPTIVVGNLVAGGSGKTPLVLAIASRLRAEGWEPAIVSRGYGGRVASPRKVALTSDPAEVGDEPVVLARRSGCAVWVGPDRVRTVETLRREEPRVDVLVLDDGLQHYRLRRHVEVAVVDARGFGNGFLLPAGPLREPPRRLRRVGAVIAHGIDPAALRAPAGRTPVFRMALEGARAHRMTDARERRALSEFGAAPVHAVAGIGDPRRFFMHLMKHGVKLKPHPFPDHHRFAAADLAFGDAAPVLMTEKDAVKCRAFARPEFWVLPVEAVPEDAFFEWLLERLGKPKARRA